MGEPQDASQVIAQRTTRYSARRSKSYNQTMGSLASGHFRDAIIFHCNALSRALS